MEPRVFLFLLLPCGIIAGAAERRLISLLLEEGQEYNPMVHAVPEEDYVALPYNSMERPVINGEDSVPLKFTVSLQQIVGLDEKNQILTTNIWLTMTWYDPFMRWNESEHNNINNIRISPDRLWKPDILLYNSASADFYGAYQSSLIVYSDGTVEQIPPGIFQSTCKVDMTWFPFDEQICDLKFGTWTNHESLVNLTMNDGNGGAVYSGEADTSTFSENAEWHLVSAHGVRHGVPYMGDNYIDVTFQIHIRRRTIYYFNNLIGPCVLIASMVIFGFQTPPDSGEKLTLCITILMSLTFFMNMVSAMQPPSSNTPLIGTYFSCIMVMVACSVVCTVFILNFHERTVDTHEMPQWVECIFLQWLPWLLRMDRPGRPLTAKSILLRQRLRQLEQGDKPAHPGLVTPDLLDSEEDFLAGGIANKRFPLSPPSPRPLLTVGPRPPNSSPTISGLERELRNILREVVVISSKIKKDEEEGGVAGEWKYAAMVMDRLCLVVFLAFTLILSLAVFCSAPHVIVP